MPQFAAALLHILYMDHAQNKSKQVKLLNFIIVFPNDTAVAEVYAFRGVFSIFLTAAFSSSYQKKKGWGSKMLVTDIQRGWLHQRQLDCSKQTKRTPVVSGNKCAQGGPDHPHSQPDRISLLFSFQHLKSLKCF